MLVTSMWNSWRNPELKPCTQSICRLSCVWFARLQLRGGSGGPAIEGRKEGSGVRVKGRSARAEELGFAEISPAVT